MAGAMESTSGMFEEGGQGAKSQWGGEQDGRTGQ